MAGAKTQPRRWQNRMRANATLMEQFANASDRLRSVVARQYRPRADRALQARCRSRATRALTEAAAELTRIAEDLERAEAGDAQ